MKRLFTAILILFLAGSAFSKENINFILSANGFSGKYDQNVPVGAQKQDVELWNGVNLDVSGEYLYFFGNNLAVGFKGGISFGDVDLQFSNNYGKFLDINYTAFGWNASPVVGWVWGRNTFKTSLTISPIKINAYYLFKGDDKDYNISYPNASSENLVYGFNFAFLWGTGTMTGFQIGCDFPWAGRIKYDNEVLGTGSNFTNIYIALKICFEK